MVVNTHRTWSRRSWGALVAGMALTFAPFALDIDPGDGGGALLLVGLLIGLTGLICALVFRRDADKLDALDAGQDCLARWRFSQADWSKFRAREEIEESESKRGLAAMVTVLSFLIGGPFAVAAGKNGVFIVGALALVSSLCWALALYLPGRRLAPDDESSAVDVLIGRDGVYLPGEFHCWTSFAAQFSGAQVRGGLHPVLELTYRIYQRHGWNTYHVRVPIPEDALAEAVRVCDALMSSGACHGSMRKRSTPSRPGLA